MKRFTRSAWTLLLGTVLLALGACSQDLEYARAIPADALYVVSVDAKALAEKADLDSEKHKPLIDEVLSVLQDTELRARLSQDPGASGLKFSSPAFIFGSQSYIAGLFKVKNESDLEHLITQSLMQVQPSAGLQQENGFRYTLSGERQEIVLAFDSERFLIVSALVDSISPLTVTRQLMAQARDASVLPTPLFTAMNRGEADVRFGINYGELINMAQQFRQEMETSTDSLPPAIDSMLREELWKGLHYVGRLAFDDGQAKLTLSLQTENERAQDWLDKGYAFYRPLEHEYAKYFPANAILYGAVGINGAATTDLITAMPPLREVFDVFRTEYQVDIEKLLLSLNGDLALGMQSLNMQGTHFAAYASLRDTAPLRDLLRTFLTQPADSAALSSEAPDHTHDLGCDHDPLIENNNFVESENGEFVYSGNGQIIHMGFEGNRFYLTNKPGGQWTESQTNVLEAPYAQELKGATMFYAFNVQPLTPLLAFLGDAGGQVGKVSHLSIYGTQDREVILDLRFVDKKTNALKQLVGILETLQ